MFIYDTAHVYFKFGLLDLYVGFFQNNQKAWNAGEKWMRKVVVVALIRQIKYIRNHYYLHCLRLSHAGVTRL